jgi:hypothetical protein
MHKSILYPERILVPSTLIWLITKFIFFLEPHPKLPVKYAQFSEIKCKILLKAEPEPATTGENNQQLLANFFFYL